MWDWTICHFKSLGLIPIVILFSTTSFAQGEAGAKPLHPREQKAFLMTCSNVEDCLEEKGIEIESFEIYLRAFKKEKELQLWGKNQTDSSFHWIKSYPLCAISGQLGPKRKEGDKQIPEGFYYIESFMPNSPYLLSLVINYPNHADQIKGDPKKPGSDIHIHGDCISTGCLSINNEDIQELYTFCKQAEASGQQYIELHIFPFNYELVEMDNLFKQDPKLESYRSFWESLAPAFYNFEANYQLPDYRVTRAGDYVVLPLRQ
jgi:murein L,D-transpeptidase YafK